MKNFTISGLLFLLFVFVACNSNSAPSDQSINQTAASHENAPNTYLTPGQKSIHLFDLPEGTSESQFLSAVARLNSTIAEMGYSGVGYHVYKEERDSIGAYRYFMEGLWPDSETYSVVHQSDEWKAAFEENKAVIKAIQDIEIYRRMLKVKVMQ